MSWLRPTIEVPNEIWGQRSSGEGNGGAGATVKLSGGGGGGAVGAEPSAVLQTPKQRQMGTKKALGTDLDKCAEWIYRAGSFPVEVLQPMLGSRVSDVF